MSVLLFNSFALESCGVLVTNKDLTYFITITMHQQEMVRDALLLSDGMKPTAQHGDMTMWPIALIFSLYYNLTLQLNPLKKVSKASYAFWL